ncbi:hypothetical protein N9L68_05385 [bacterium]|nr:hypothetical protein [bacterium]
MDSEWPTERGDYAVTPILTEFDEFEDDGRMSLHNDPASYDHDADDEDIEGEGHQHKDEHYEEHTEETVQDPIGHRSSIVPRCC